MAKQTLKSLLGLSGKREQVELNLDDQVFQAPSVQAGNYRVAPPRYSKTNAATNIANALGRYAGPIARQLGQIEDERQTEFANIAKGTPTEILQAIQKGDLDPVQDQLSEYSSKLDEAERKKLIKFSENPNNYIRASRVIGDRLANQYQADLIENRDLYSNKRDENGDLIPARDQMNEVRDQLIKENNLTGYALRAFIESSNQFETQQELEINSRQDEIFKQEVRYNTRSAMVSAAKIGLTDETKTTFKQNWATLTQNMTMTEQIELLDGVVTDLAVIDTVAADNFLTAIDTDESFLTLGSGSEISESLITDLGKKVDTIRINNVELAQDQEKVAKSAIDKAFTEDEEKLVNGESLGFREIPNLQGDGTVTVDLSSVTNTVELYTAYKDAYVNQHEDNTDRSVLTSYLSQKIEDINNKAFTFGQSAGIKQIEADLKDTFTATIVIGNTTQNAYGLGDTEIQAKIDAYTQPYQAELEELYNNPTLTDTQKNKQAKVIANKAQNEVTKKLQEDTQTFVTTRNTIQFENSVGLSATNNSYTTDIINQISSRKLEDTMTPRPEEVLGTVKEFVDTTRQQVRDILNAPLTEAELNSGNLAQVLSDRQLQARDFLLEAKETFIAEQQDSDDDDDSKEDKVGKAKTTETIEPRTLNTSGNYAPSGGGRAAADKNRNYNNKVRGYEQDNRQAAENGHADYLAEIRALAKSDAEKRKTSTIKTGRASYYSKNGFRNYYIRESYDHAATERLYEDKPAITIDELESGTLNGFSLGQVDVTKTVVLSPSIVINAEDNRELITEYAVALGLDTDDNTLNTFIQTQASLMERNFHLNIYND